MHDDLSTFERIASCRKTTKVMSDRDLPPCDRRQLVERLLASAGWAPFHRMCSIDHRSIELPKGGDKPIDPLPGIEPWRFHAIDSTECRRLRAIAQGMGEAGKIPAMLASAMATIVATWLPNSPSDSCWTTSQNSGIGLSNPNSDSINAEFFEPSVENVEHIAAAAAAVQSLLLAATAAGLQSYWSSGGVLRNPTILKVLGVPSNQRVLGVVFLFPATLLKSQSVQVVGSKLREARGGVEAWSRWVTIDSDEQCPKGY